VWLERVLQSGICGVYRAARLDAPLFSQMPPRSKPCRIAVLIDLHEYFTRSVAVGIRKFFRTRDRWVCETIDPANNEDWSWLKEGNWDGVVAYGIHKSLVTFLQKWGIPSVNVSNSLPPLDSIPRVISDDYAVGKLAAEHFLERGLRHFAYFGNSAYVAQVRHEGFQETIEAAGLRCDKVRPDFQVEHGHWLRTEIPEIVQRIAEGRWPLGVFCANDGYARFVVGCCAAHDIHMPEQVAVVGVNNSEVSDGLAEIPFSSVELQLEKIGFTAMEVLNGWIETGKRPEEPVLVPPKRVVVRLSSDLVAVNDEAVSHALRLIREDALNPIDIREIVRKVGVSRRILEKRFKDATGRTPYAEVLRLRIEKAKSLLADTNLRISEVAELSGFSHAKQLHVIFTRGTGMPPSAYRKQFQNPR